MIGLQHHHYTKNYPRNFTNTSNITRFKQIQNILRFFYNAEVSDQPITPFYKRKYSGSPPDATSIHKPHKTPQSHYICYPCDTTNQISKTSTDKNKSVTITAGTIHDLTQAKRDLLSWHRILCHPIYSPINYTSH